MKEVPVPCCKCKQLPEIKAEPGDLWYAICRCGKWHRHEFVGTTYNGAVRHWNDGNRPIKRTGNKRYEDEDYLA